MINDEDLCSGCITWGLEAVEIKGEKKFDFVDVGAWQPLQGLHLFDDLFPHVTGGFRQRVIAVASINVSCRCIMIAKKCGGLETMRYFCPLQFPPWQIFTRDKNGAVTDYSGLMFELMDELARKLNFS